MKKRILVILAVGLITVAQALAVLLILSAPAYSQTVMEPYEVGTWRGYRTAAVTYTFDDGSPNQYNIAIPMFNEFDYDLTLFIVTSPDWDWPADWAELQAAADAGHEIASHSVTHTSLRDLSDSLQIVELRDSRDTINARITGQKCVTFANPYCTTIADTIISKFYIAARICSGRNESSTPSNFMYISSIICGPSGTLRTTQNFKDKFQSAASSEGWCVLLVHGVDNDGGWSSLSSTILRESLAYLDSNRVTYWVSTFSNVSRYILERNAVSVTELSAEDNSITVQVTDTLDNAIFDYPVTLRRPLPQGWADAEVSQNGQDVGAQIVEINSVQHVMFDVVPDAGDVVITKTASTSVPHQGSLNLLVPSSSQNYPNPFNPTTTIEFTLPARDNVRLTLVNALGQVVKELASGYFSAGRHEVVVDATKFSSGIYFYRLQAGSFVDVKKLVVSR
jgi:hypothetical protein